MEAVFEVYAVIVGFLNLPAVRAASVAFAAASLVISIWLFRKTVRLFATQEQHFLVDQSRFVDDLWQKSNALILSDDEYIRVVKDMFDYESEDHLVRSFMIFNIMNPMYVAWRSAQQGVMPKASYMAARDNILSHFTGDRAWLLETLRTRGYATDFVAMCEDWFRANPRPSDASLSKAA